MAPVEGRIPEFSFKVSVVVTSFFFERANIAKVGIGIAFGTATLATTARIVIRLRSQKRFHLDDYLLIFSCICLIAGTILLYLGTSAIFFVERLTLNGIGAVIASPADEIDILEQLLFYQKINWAYLALTWTTIFSVKSAFLVFFRYLVKRLPAMQRYWVLVVAFTAVIFAFIICDGFIACLQLGIAAGKLSCLELLLDRTLTGL